MTSESSINIDIIHGEREGRTKNKWQDYDLLVNYTILGFRSVQDHIATIQKIGRGSKRALLVCDCHGTSCTHDQGYVLRTTLLCLNKDINIGRSKLNRVMY